MKQHNNIYTLIYKQWHKRWIVIVEKNSILPQYHFVAPEQQLEDCSCFLYATTSKNEKRSTELYSRFKVNFKESVKSRRFLYQYILYMVQFCPSILRCKYDIQQTLQSEKKYIYFLDLSYQNLSISFYDIDILNIDSKFIYII